ncbi:efflux RND transporter periplasmic adaptor subunit [Phorcysia thermohydrogeniphila]|uniref:HlyD family secretion protein/macrolide-specific efflux system membrane fusion protein n=1 Tax=Phorcysia thermohydrogeniphila TaxID=936138 RepID=A0A4R1GI75_9BACT|nr:efflux RND transporter periplasmic adaptor subunit [Phorcysia thermohydrogeniphila]TCK06585.1 HlyD family secretion protein/macrolide-specific efflux system membrane fusion protein [Phorcysia thermohydrogeniphila]
MKKFLAFLLIVLAAVGFIYFKSKKEVKIVPVETVTVKRGEVKRVIDATGIIKPQVGAEIKVGARISGTVVKENVKVGDYVKKGDLIAVIDNRELKEELKKAKARLEEIKRTYPEKIKAQELKLQSALAELRSAEAKLRAEEENYRLKKWELERQEELFKAGYTTEQKLKQARFEFRQAESNLKSAQEALKKAKLEVEVAKRDLEELKKKFKAELSVAEANLKQAEIRYSYSFIYAPKSGIISFVSTQEGETVVAGLNAPQFVTILDPEKLENWIYVDETEIGKVKKGMEVVFTVDTYRDRVFRAKVEEIYPQPEKKNNVVYYIVVARGFKNVELLRPEMTTHNSIISGVKKGVLVVPNAAVKWKNGKYVVYKVEGRQVKEVPVKVGWSDEQFTEIVSGLKEGDTVAIRVEKR